MKLGSTWDYLIVATEGYRSAGSASITITTPARLAGNGTETQD
jgi:hypothetical protein